MTSFSITGRLPDLSLWEKIADKRIPLDFMLELTARCNNNCAHCYINLPAGDHEAKQNELTLTEISGIADQAVALGTLWCLITGGEPLLRKDFKEIYLMLRRKGLLISLFTNACLVDEEMAAFLKKYPPRDIEVTVYGVTRETYEQVTRTPGSFNAFKRGLDLLIKSGLKIRLKAMALRSNVHELQAIADFCRAHTMDFFRFDPLLHLRYDGNAQRNREIRAERLSPREVVSIEQADEERAHALEKGCDKLIFAHEGHTDCNHLFHCGAGNSSFAVSYDGFFRLCSDLWHPDTIFDLRKGKLADAWNRLVPEVRDLRSDAVSFLEHCRNCPIVNLCMWCPAHAHLETGELDGETPYFCEVAHARAAAIQERVNLKKEDPAA